MSDNKDFWDNSWKQIKHDFWTTSFCKKVIKQLKNKDKLSLLDLWSGFWLDSLAFLNSWLKNVTCFDISEVWLEKVKNDALKLGFKNLSTIQWDFTNINLNKKFNIIYSSNSLHYFDSESTQKIFDNLYNYLTEDGRLYVRVKATKLITDKNICIKDQNWNFKHLFTTWYAKTLLWKYKIISIDRVIDEHYTLKNWKQDFVFIDIFAKK